MRCKAAVELSVVCHNPEVLQTEFLLQRSADLENSFFVAPKHFVTYCCSLKYLSLSLCFTRLSLVLTLVAVRSRMTAISLLEYPSTKRIIIALSQSTRVLTNQENSWVKSAVPSAPEVI